MRTNGYTQRKRRGASPLTNAGAWSRVNSAGRTMPMKAWDSSSRRPRARPAERHQQVLDQLVERRDPPHHQVRVGAEADRRIGAAERHAVAPLLEQHLGLVDGLSRAGRLEGAAARASTGTPGSTRRSVSSHRRSPPARRSPRSFRSGRAGAFGPGGGRRTRSAASFACRTQSAMPTPPYGEPVRNTPGARRQRCSIRATRPRCPTSYCGIDPATARRASTRGRRPGGHGLDVAATARRARRRRGPSGRSSPSRPTKQRTTARSANGRRGHFREIHVHAVTRRRAGRSADAPPGRCTRSRRGAAPPCPADRPA